MTTLMLIFASVTSTLNLPTGLLSAVCFVESRHRPYAIHKDDGTEDSVGLCQMHLSTARSLGYRGTAKGLLNPTTNAFYAGCYLRKQLKRYGGNIRKAVAAYNAGSFHESTQGLTLNRRYVIKVFQAWQENR